MQVASAVALDLIYIAAIAIFWMCRDLFHRTIKEDNCGGARNLPTVGCRW